jgi:hypothetical protein
MIVPIIEGLWFLLAIGCFVVGMILTDVHGKTPPTEKRKSRVEAYQRARSSPPRRANCSRCAQPLDRDARFCGACGLHIYHEPEPRRMRREPVRRA